MEFFGLLGEKLGHSLSPEIHKMILDEINKMGAYRLFQIENSKLKEFIEAIKLIDVRGFNVTIPYKEEVMKYLDYISDEAKAIGAVNTVKNIDGKLYGYNTDYFGFGDTLVSKGIDVRGKRVVILGAGGACKAAVSYLLDNNVEKLYIVSRKPDVVKISFNNNKIEVIDYGRLKEVKGDILINSTPVGMYPNMNNSPVGKEIINNFNILMDLIYNPMETMFLKLGRENNKICIGGLYMLVSQAVKAQEIYQEMYIESKVINKIYDEISVKFK